MHVSENGALAAQVKRGNKPFSTKQKRVFHAESKLTRCRSAQIRSVSDVKIGGHADVEFSRLWMRLLPLYGG